MFEEVLVSAGVEVVKGDFGFCSVTILYMYDNSSGINDSEMPYALLSGSLLLGMCAF